MVTTTTLIQYKVSRYDIDLEPLASPACVSTFEVMGNTIVANYKQLKVSLNYIQCLTSASNGKGSCYIFFKLIILFANNY